MASLKQGQGSVMSTEKLICEIYKSPKHEGMYLYVRKSDAMKKVPEALLEKFGKPKAAMVLLLTPEKKLARANTEKVIASIKESGYYLQMPPPKDQEMQAINLKNSKLSL